MEPTESDVIYVDLMYFGYEWDEDSKKNQEDFMWEAKAQFNEIVFKNAYDNIKGYRQEVFIDKKNEDNYFAWVLAFGWYELSLTLQLVMMSKDERPRFDKYFSLAKQNHPQQFKPQTNE